MSTIIRSSTEIRQNYNDISNLCKEVQEPIFLTKNGEGDLVVMDINTYDRLTAQLELREKLIEVEELRKMGVPDMPARSFSESLRAKIKERANVQS